MPIKITIDKSSASAEEIEEFNKNTSRKSLGVIQRQSRKLGVDFSDLQICNRMECFIRGLRRKGLALVCFNRLGNKDSKSYKSYLAELYRAEGLNDKSADCLSEVIITWAQPQDSELSCGERNIEIAFEENKEVKDLIIENEKLKQKLQDIEFEVELRKSMESPIKSIFKSLVFIVKSVERKQLN